MLREAGFSSAEVLEDWKHPLNRHALPCSAPASHPPAAVLSVAAAATAGRVRNTTACSHGHRGKACGTSTCPCCLFLDTTFKAANSLPLPCSPLPQVLHRACMTAAAGLQVISPCRALDGCAHHVTWHSGRQAAFPPPDGRLPSLPYQFIQQHALKKLNDALLRHSCHLKPTNLSTGFYKPSNPFLE